MYNRKLSSKRAIKLKIIPPTEQAEVQHIYFRTFASWKRSILEKVTPGKGHSWKRSLLEKVTPWKGHSLKRSLLEKVTPWKGHSLKRSLLEKVTPWKGHSWKRSLLEIGKGHSLKRSLLEPRKHDAYAMSRPFIGWTPYRALYVLWKPK